MSSLDTNKDNEVAKNEEKEELLNTETTDTEATPVVEEEKKIESTTLAEEPAKVEEKAVVETETDNPPVVYASMSKSELIDALKVLVEGDVNLVKSEVDTVKHLFYKKLKEELEAKKEKFIEEGGVAETFIPEKEESEDTLKNLLGLYRTKRTNHLAQIEKQKENNFLQKQYILEQMKSLSESNEDVSSNIKEFKELQQKWKDIGQIPQAAVADLWRQYNAVQEAFWDLVKIDNELREYDFKKNLELKTTLCEAAERLDAESDVVSAFRQLQALHDEWREIGPVARNLREELWTRFKNASTVINKKHQEYFETLRKSEDENLETKVALCEKIEAIDYSNLKTFKEWDEASKKIMGLQAEWRTIGYAPRKSSQAVYDRYRKACDDFFAAKSEFFKDVKGEMSQNLEKKKALCEQAEALKDSSDWKETSEKLIQIQKEWKTIGAVQKKYSDELWKRFIAACDYFFEQKNKNTSSQRSVEQENLVKKKELIEKINSLKKQESDKDSLAALKELIAQWNGVGHVPFKEKDKIYKEYRAAIDKKFDELNVDVNNRRMDTFRSNLEDIASKGENKLYREREKMMRAYEHLKSEISTYENNIGFFTSSSKKGGGLIKDMERKIQQLNEELSLLEEKIKLLEEKLK